MKVAIVVLETLSIPCVYDAPEPSQGSYGGDWGSPQVTAHLEVPEGLDPQCLMATRDDSGEIVLLEDPAKVTQKTQAQWASVRAQQRELLYKSDWTCSVTDYEVPNKAEWVQYRQALREVTTQADPFAIVWPTAPGA
jgi:hypothetical protein